MTTAFSDTQLHRLAALQDTILPASADGTMPSAAEIDFPAYLAEQAPEYRDELTAILDRFDDGFPGLPLDRRVALVRAFSEADAKAFRSLVFRVYDSYYQDDRVRAAIGARPGPPFPGGHSIPAGDLSSLEAVKARGKGYRR
ncbi:hypothetical protein [Thalassobaculum sp.]|uniref:hypothetical protein n=1 Tax=Thalassobaculum sp. TaxID=2022740 RepID=UPI0032EF990F